MIKNEENYQIISWLFGWFARQFSLDYLKAEVNLSYRKHLYGFKVWTQLTMLL